MKPLRRLLVAAAFALAASAVSAATYTGLYTFGDSLSDPGNLALAIGADPAQVISGNGYIPSRPYASNQFSNGDVWATTFANLIGLPQSGRPFSLGGGNFAFGGARVATDGVGQSPSLSAQEGLFLGLTGGVAPPGALYVIAGGGNDARDAITAASAAGNPSAVIGAAAAAYASSTGVLVDRLQAAGAQHIIVWDVPDLSLAPAITNLGAGASFLARTVAQSMNAQLSSRLAIESGVTIFDVFGFQDLLVSNPAAFGLVNVTDACGGPSGCNPATALYWDGIHPTATGHALLAQAMLVTAVPEPAEYVLLGGGLIVLVARRTRRLHRR